MLHLCLGFILPRDPHTGDFTMLSRRQFIRHACILACIPMCGVVVPQHPAFSYEGPPVPDPDDLSGLVTATVLAVDAGNKSGNYAALHAMGSPAFQSAYPADKLSGLFGNLRASGLDLAIVKDKVPLTSRPPTLDANGRLRILGFYELPGIQLVYDVLYDYDQAGRRWTLAAISVKDRPLPPQPELLQPQ